MRVRVIGIGTPYGDDGIGPRVVARLAAEGLPPGVDAIALERPDGLLDALAGVDAAVVVDASRSGLAPGTVHEPAREALREAFALSSHGLGVAAALALAEALGRSPKRLAIVAVELAAGRGLRLSRPVRRALPEALRRVRSRLAAWAGESPAPEREASASCVGEATEDA